MFTKMPLRAWEFVFKCVYCTPCPIFFRGVRTAVYRLTVKCRVINAYILASISGCFFFFFFFHFVIRPAVESKSAIPFQLEKDMSFNVLESKQLKSLLV